MKLQDGYLKRYLDQNTTLSRTLVVKFKEAAMLINEGLVADGVKVDTHDQTTWKYYQNLAGIYHSTDTMMSVVSIDTLETIEFTVENLKIHTATAKAHAYGTRHYNALVYKYPKQEALINGILTPADIHKAIEAENGTILAYPASLIESNEVSLLPELQDYIKRIFHRWFNVQFAMSDNLYCGVFFTMLSSFVLPKLLNLRVARCKTAEAHSFHVRMYLASHGGLDAYLPYMTLKQSLWLYRNICYLERNAGKVSQFKVLVEKLLTDRGIPLGEYSLRHQDSFESNLMPISKARRKLINVDQNVASVGIFDLDVIFEKEYRLDSGNELFYKTYAEREKFRISTSSSSVMQTKLLESSMVDYTDSVPEPFEIVALRQWAYMANAGLYDVMVTFVDSATSETRSIFAKDAFFYMQYISLMADGITLETVPEYLNMQQRLNPKPTLEDLLSVVPYKERDLTAILKEVLRRQPIIEPCFSVSAFNKQIQTLTDEAYWHWFLISSMQDMYERALVENAIRRLYADTRMKYNLSSQNVAAWLDKTSLPAYSYDRDEAQALVKVIYEAATGVVIDDSRVLKNIQKQMIGLMGELSSYTTRIMTEINTEEIVQLNWPAIRLGLPMMSQSDTRNVDNGVLMLAATSYSKDSVYSDILVDSEVHFLSATAGHISSILIDPTSTVVTKPHLYSMADDTGPPLQMNIAYEGQNVALETKMMLPGYTSFDRLPESLRMKLKSHY